MLLGQLVLSGAPCRAGPTPQGVGVGLKQGPLGGGLGDLRARPHRRSPPPLPPLPRSRRAAPTQPSASQPKQQLVGSSTRVSAGLHGFPTVCTMPGLQPRQKTQRGTSTVSGLSSKGSVLLPPIPAESHWVPRPAKGHTGCLGFRAPQKAPWAGGKGDRGRLLLLREEGKKDFCCGGEGKGRKKGKEGKERGRKGKERGGEGGIGKRGRREEGRREEREGGRQEGSGEEGGTGRKP